VLQLDTAEDPRSKALYPERYADGGPWKDLRGTRWSGWERLAARRGRFELMMVKRVMRERPSPIRFWMSSVPEARSSIRIVCDFAPRPSVSKVAQHYGVNANLLFTRGRRGERARQVADFVNNISG
jgi:hypothetical protein